MQLTCRGTTQAIGPRERAREPSPDSPGFSFLNSVPCKAWLKPTLEFRAPLLCLYCKYPLLISVITLSGFRYWQTKALTRTILPHFQQGLLLAILSTYSLLGNPQCLHDLLLFFFSRTKCSQCQAAFCPNLPVTSSTFMPEKTRVLQKAFLDHLQPQESPSPSIIRLRQAMSDRSLNPGWLHQHHLECVKNCSLLPLSPPPKILIQ